MFLDVAATVCAAMLCAGHASQPGAGPWHALFGVGFSAVILGAIWLP